MVARQPDHGHLVDRRRESLADEARAALRVLNFGNGGFKIEFAVIIPSLFRRLECQVQIAQRLIGLRVGPLHPFAEFSRLMVVLFLENQPANFRQILRRAGVVPAFRRP